MRASRLLSILMLLQTRGRLSAPALAAELAVSQRTVLRDIDQLSAAGVPVWAERGRDGGFQLRPGWSTQLTGLTEAEAQALFLAGLPGPATELGLGSASSSARLKMLAALPEALRADASRVTARLHIDPMDWYRAATPPAHLQAVARAVRQQRVVNMRYDSWQAVRERSVKPLGLVLKAGVWYLVALAEGRTEPRTYRLSNLLSLNVLDKTFSYPKRFHLPGFWQASTRRFEAGIYTSEAKLRTTGRGLRLLKELSAAVAEAAARSAVTDPRHADFTCVTVPIESIDHAARQFLGLGVDAEVLGPPALRERMGRLASALAAAYSH